MSLAGLPKEVAAWCGAAVKGFGHPASPYPVATAAKCVLRALFDQRLALSVCRKGLCEEELPRHPRSGQKSQEEGRRPRRTVSAGM